MRNLIIAVGLFTFLFGVPQLAQAHPEIIKASADEHGNHMNPCMKDMKMKHHGMKHEMKKEGMEIMLDAITLIKDSTSDPVMKKRAKALETRMRAHIQKCENMHEKMKEMHNDGKGKHGNPCAKTM